MLASLQTTGRDGLRPFSSDDLRWTEHFVELLVAVICFERIQPDALVLKDAATHWLMIGRLHLLSHAGQNCIQSLGSLIDFQ